MDKLKDTITVCVACNGEVIGVHLHYCDRCGQIDGPVMELTHEAWEIREDDMSKGVIHG